MRRPGPEILLSLASVALTLLLGEVLLSLFFPQPTYRRVLRDSPRIFAASDEMPYALAPNSTGTLVTPEFRVQFKINSLGYRGDEFQKHKTSRIRILAIGDSFTFGYGVASTEAYPSVLETELRRVLRTDDIEVINAGFAACYYPDTYYLYLKHRGLELNPDIIIIGVFVGNDLDHDRADEHEWTASDNDGLPLKIRSKTSHVTDGYWVSRHRQVRYSVPIVRDSHLLQAWISAVRPGGSVPFNQWMYRSEYENRTVQATLRVQKLLSAMGALALRRGSSVAFVLMPAREQVYPEEYNLSKYHSWRTANSISPSESCLRTSRARVMCASTYCPA